MVVKAAIRNSAEHRPRTRDGETRGDVVSEFVDEGRPLERGLDDGTTVGPLLVPRRVAVVRWTYLAPTRGDGWRRRQNLWIRETMLVGSNPGAASDPYVDPFVTPARGFFRRFLELHRASDEGLRRYAAAYGLLGLCAGCGRRPHVPGGGARWCPCPRWSPSTIHASVRSEPALAWRRYSRGADSVVLMAAHALRGEHVDDSTRARVVELATDLIGGDSLDAMILRYAELVDDQRAIVASAVNAWLRSSPLTLGIESDATGFSPKLMRGPSHGALWPALGEQLAKVVARAEGLYGCVECGAWFFPPEKPRKDAPPLCAKHANDSIRAKHRMRRKRGHDLSIAARGTPA
jgi:hypothetical protein